MADEFSQTTLAAFKPIAPMLRQAAADAERRAHEVFAHGDTYTHLLFARAEVETLTKALAAAEADAAKLVLPPIVREVLEWYASDPSLWVAWNEAGWAQEDAAKASGHYVYIGEDNRGHNEYRPNGVRAEEALEALNEWQEAIDAARNPAKEG
jgi:hypothetical protein